MKRKGKIFIISGPSGAGKTTIAQKILEDVENIERSISCTTRAKRDNEVEGRDYRFVTERAFKIRIKKKTFLEWALVLDNFYGTLKKDVSEAIKRGSDILLCIDVQGAAQVRRQRKDVVSIFIIPPRPKELKKRLLKRGEKAEGAAKRIALAKKEMLEAEKYDYIVKNDFLQKATDLVKYIVYATRSGKKKKKIKEVLNVLCKDR